MSLSLSTLTLDIFLEGGESGVVTAGTHTLGDPDTLTGVRQREPSLGDVAKPLVMIRLSGVEILH